MSQEHVFSDFSGGMNALAAVDKLDPKECLLAENVRLDETGNILSAGALTRQNGAPYTAAGGTNAAYVHSTYWNPSLGAVAGVGQDVFIGATLGSMASGLAGKNSTLQKMSFASAPNRVYFDVGSVGYWTDETNLVTVDWPPPDSATATTTGPTLVGTGTQLGGPYRTWTSPNNINSLNSNTAASVSFTGTAGGVTSNYLLAMMSTNSFSISTAVMLGIGITFTVNASVSMAPNFIVTLLKNGVPVGNQEISNQIIPAGLSVISLGGASDLWGTTWTQADVNSGTFGFSLWIQLNGKVATISVYNGKVTISQLGTGMVAGVGAAGTLTGTYTWKYTFVAANGEESQVSGSSTSAVLSTQQGTLTSISTGDVRTVARNIYRKGNTLTSYYLVGTIQDNLSTTYSDNQTDIAVLAQGTILAGDVPGDYPNSRLGNQTVRFPALHYDRLFWVVPGTNKIIWSKPLNGFAYPSINSINVGDSKPISRIVSIFGELIIIKPDSIWRLTGTDETSFNLTQTPSAVGTDLSFTVAVLPDKIVFANRWGLWVFNGYTSQPLTPKLDLWFKQDDRTGEELFGVNGFHPPEVASATVPLNFEARGNSEKYVLAYAEAGQAQNNALLVFDMKHGNITKRVTGGLPLSVSIDPVNGFVYVGDSNGFISLLDDWNGATQAGQSANFDFQHGYQNLQRGSNAVLWALEFYLDTDGQSLTPSVYYDGGTASETLAPIVTANLQRVVRPVASPVSRKMQSFSWRLNGSVNPINSNGSPQIQIVHVKALYDVRTGRSRTGQ